MSKKFIFEKREEADGTHGYDKVAELRWIPITERIPTKEDSTPLGEVLVLHKNGVMRLYFWHVISEIENIVAFLPLNWLPKWEGDR